ncbi:MAG: type II secretion system F family protein [Lachnospiraceae bacterium]|nr:type II secretion system F family protein [Lachnospiraceae bacterium]
MADYGYRAINALGKEIKGSIEADNKEQARQKLVKMKLTVLSITEQSMWTKDLNIQIGGYPTPRDLSVMCRQFSSMMRAGVGIIDCLRMLQEQSENQRIKDALKNVRVSVEKGDTLAGAMRVFPKVFPPLMVNMLAAGESSGNLDIALERMAVQYERSTKTQAMVKKAMIYPIVVFLVAIVVSIVMLVVVIPNYEKMFVDLGTELPWITVMYVNLSKVLRSYWYIIVPVIGVIIVSIYYFAKTDSGKHVFGKIVLTVPVFKNLTVKSASSMMARTLGTLLGSGVSLIEATGMVADVMSNVYFKEAMLDAKEQISIGMPLSRPLEDAGIFPPMVYHMVSIGEEAGTTEEMLDRLADYYDEEVEMAVQSLMAAMEPMIIIVLAVVVGGLLAACMAPMLSMYGALETI